MNGLRQLNFLSVMMMLLFLSIPWSFLQAQEPTEEMSTEITEEELAAPEAEPEVTEPTLEPPRSLTAGDKEYDKGGAIQLNWEHPEGERPEIYVIERRRKDTEEWSSIGVTVRNSYVDSSTRDDVEYQYRIKAAAGEEESEFIVSDLAVSSDTWFRADRLTIFISIVIFTSFVVYFILAARRGVELFIRRIPGLTAVEEAIGRATEMGRPVLYVPGTGYIEDVATVASLNLLGEIARRTVRYNVRIICPNMDPIVYTVAREIVKETYAQEGHPDFFDPNSVFFVVSDQFAFAAAVDGIMIREKPATNFLLGLFRAESLILAETGAMTGAIQIAGTDDTSQLPFFITACDYTLIGEELYAASSYLSGEPILLGTIKAQDYGKLVILAVMILGTLLSLIFNMDIQNWLFTYI